MESEIRLWRILVTTFVAAVILLIVGYASWQADSWHDLDIVVHQPQLSKDKVTVSGRVQRKGIPVENALVTVILAGAKGERINSLLTKTTQQGEFKVEHQSVNRSGASIAATVKEITLLAVGPGAQQSANQSWFRGKCESSCGREHVRLSDDNGTFSRDIRLSVSWILMLPAFFLINLLIGLVPWARQARYIATVFLAGLFAITMFLTIGIGIASTHDQARTGDVLDLRIGYIAAGTYLANGPLDWHAVAGGTYDQVASSQDAGNGNNHHRRLAGFGAPLWVILLAVMGAALMLVAVMIKEISNNPEKPKDGAAVSTIEERVERILLHQLFVLFSPLGAIFVYQALVTIGSASEPLTVAVAALGAGATANLLLQKAVDKARDLFLGDKNKPVAAAATKAPGAQA